MKFTKLFFFVIIGSIALYAIFLSISDFTQVYDKLHNFKTDFLPFILLLTPLSWLVLFIRWKLLLKKSNIILPNKKNFELYLTGFALSVTPGKIGELLKSQLYKENLEVPRRITIPLIVLERLYNLVGLILISIVGIWFFEFSLFVIIIPIIFTAFIFILISNKKFYHKFLALLGKIKFTAKYSKYLLESYDVIKSGTRGTILFYASGLSAIFWLIHCMIAYFIFLSFGIDFLDFLNVVSIYATSIILGAASFLPEGIGVMESSFVGLLTLHGVELSIAIPLVILVRIFTLWYNIIAGFIALKLSGSLSIHPDNS